MEFALSFPALIFMLFTSAVNVTLKILYKILMPYNSVTGRSGGIHKKPEGRCDKICGPASDEIVIQRRVILSFDGK